MEYLVIVAVVVVLAAILLPNKSKLTPTTKRTYQYAKKGSIATRVELIFYQRLVNIAGDRYQIVPQAHLSSFINHKIKGQNWRGAFSVINGKSIDFLLCEKMTLQPVYAIELDDATHLKEDRIKRDQLVEGILREINIPLVRFKQGEWDSEEAIALKMQSAATQTRL